jgi:hypothetical protein
MKSSVVFCGVNMYLEELECCFIKFHILCGLYYCFMSFCELVSVHGCCVAWVFYTL